MCVMCCIVTSVRMKELEKVLWRLESNKININRKSKHTKEMECGKEMKRDSEGRIIKIDTIMLCERECVVCI